ncbi:Fatty acid desaturase [Aureliella helgolandensis]|uniref:Fatty acid desaturase n=2 Tax=Aureliella helgolandensis TaxID=2527968 RepID=A0A518G8V4_9BACT|nr:Fatty acid desaturase [Aureliella helgolandensis]
MEPAVDTESQSESSRAKAAARDLLIASKFFAQERRGASWWHLSSTLAALVITASVAAWGGAAWLRILGSLLTGLILVRMFILYHDYQHHSILRNSRLASLILSVYGYLMLTPPSVWKRSHDHHHRNNSKLFGASIGSFPIMTTTNYKLASGWEKFEYRLARSPFVILFGYLIVFLFGMCVRPLLMDPRRHWDAPLAVVLHVGVALLLAYCSDWQTSLLVLILPTWVATFSGAYLFYIQHNFPAAKIRKNNEWSYADAALASSSYLELGPIMHWLTGNIGYHHVHHLNAKIPFYRLPEAMAALAELQSPGKTSLRIRDIMGCLRLKLWDVSQDRFVTFADAAARG